MTVSAGHLDIIEWLRAQDYGANDRRYRRPGAIPNVCEIMLSAALHGQMHILDWAVTRGGLVLGPPRGGISTGGRASGIRA